MQNSMIKEAIILAGGLGFRLQPVNPVLPKSLVPVAGRPFMDYILEHLLQHGIEKFIFALGHRHSFMEDYINELPKKFGPTFHYQFSIEEEPLGTGGAIKFASKKATEENVLIVNGDTLFKINMATLSAFHFNHKASCTIALKPMQDFDRYGLVEIDSAGQVQSFSEKQFCKNGLVNGGVYILNIASFLQLNFPQHFSFEKDFLAKQVTNQKIAGLVQDEYFIDIGIPEDLKKAELHFPHNFGN
ncbi:MAG TPA: nucleotidyltransferase family protein [Ferruginibacter sp.]|nr:nucleotidyltransferase family protein [Ferruginibacter sp.]